MNIHSFTLRPIWLGAVALSLLSLHAQAATDGVKTGACEVFSSGQLRNNDYVFSYDGGCKNGAADGQGTATWRLRHAPDAPPVQWKGKFSQGIFLADKYTVGAKRINSSRVLLDLGPLAAKGAAAGRLWVEGRVEGKLPPSACEPVSLQVSAQGNLADDAVAKAWLEQAYAHWVAACPGAPAALNGRNLGIKLHQGTEWAIDSYGNIPSGVAEAWKPLRTGADGKTPAWQSYRNQAAQQQAQQQRDQQVSADLQANKDRIYAFARKHGARQLVTLDALTTNPFRYGDQPILVAVRLLTARTPIEAIVQPAKRDRGDWSRVLLRGAIADWDDQGHLAAVRVKGRSTDADTDGAIVLELIDSQRCKERDCEDYLLMPGKRWLRDEPFNASLPNPTSAAQLAQR